MHSRHDEKLSTQHLDRLAPRSRRQCKQVVAQGREHASQWVHSVAHRGQVASAWVYGLARDGQHNASAYVHRFTHLPEQWRNDGEQATQALQLASTIALMAGCAGTGNLDDEGVPTRTAGGTASSGSETYVTQLVEDMDAIRHSPRPGPEADVNAWASAERRGSGPAQEKAPCDEERPRDRDDGGDWVDEGDRGSHGASSSVPTGESTTSSSYFGTWANGGASTAW